ncbi:hypothetical protein TNCV_2027571 [Trichonephila clavipes]|nr:hypothetical protein TNCV_2027571 [Trichonephila clavipes]
MQSVYIPFSTPLAFIVFPLQSRTKPLLLSKAGSSLPPDTFSPLFPSPSFLLLKKNAFKHQRCVHITPLVPSYWQVTKVSCPPSSYLRITRQNTPGPSGPRRHSSLSNIWTHLSITSPVSSIPFTQHQKRRHDYFKIGFAYCQWGTGSPLPLW